MTDYLAHTDVARVVGPATGLRSSLDRVVRAVEALGLPVENQRPDSLMAGCPVHEDKTPSMHITWRSGVRGGSVLLWCHGCQQPAKDLVVGLGLRLGDLFDEPLPEREGTAGRVGRSPAQRRAGQRRGKLGRLPSLIARKPAGPDLSVEHVWSEVERYSYVTADGHLVQEVIREECRAEGLPHKQFRQLFVTKEGRRVTRRPEGFTPVLYRAPQVAEAARTGLDIWLVEGEKDVQAAEALHVVATTNTQGGRSFPDELVDCLQGAGQVLVALDRDATGWARGVDLHAKLTQAAIAVRLLLPAVEEPKADLSDHVEAGFGLDDLLDVSVEEVAAWHALSAVEAKAKLLAQAIEEARARWALAEDGEDPAQNQRFAQRWTLETQIRQESLRDLVDHVYVQGMRTGTAWAVEAMEAADRLLTDATAQARRCHLETNVPVPAGLRPAPESAGPEPDPPRAPEPDPNRTPAAGVPDPSPAPIAPGPAVPASPGTPVRRGLGHPGGAPAWPAATKGAEASAPVFRVLGDQIVQWEPDTKRGAAKDTDTSEDGDNAEAAGKFKVLLSTVVHVTAREYLEVEADHDVEHVELLGRSTSARQRASAPRTLVAVRLQFPDDATGELLEIRVSADQWRDHSWLEALPGHPDYDHRRAGLDQLQRAILAISDNVVDEELYRSTGWRTTPEGTHRYIHRRGAITATGHEDIDVAFSGPLQRYDLPDPTTNPQVLRKAWLETSATILDRLPDRVAAPLLGQVFRAVLGHNPWVMTLVGPPGSYKTSVAAKAMQHFGERWEHKKPASSMSGNGDTFNALRFKLHHAKDTLYWMDDFAPTKSWLDAQRHLEETARLVHNQEERSRSTRDGLAITEGTGPRASGLCTSEVMPRPGSGSERILVIPLAREDIDTALLFPLDEQESRHGRALVMASFISWLAGDLTARRATYMAVAEAYADQLAAAGETVRQAAAIAHTWIGWVAITDFLLDRDVITQDEVDATRVRVDAALRAAGQAAVNPDMPRTTGARVRELLAYALRQGLVYVDDVRNGDCPPWPLAGRLGWRRTVTEVNLVGEPVRTRFDRSGIRLGYVRHDPTPRERGRVLMCESTQLEAAIKAASATQAEKLEIDRATACRALHEEGVLIADLSEGRVRHTLKCTIDVEKRVTRMVTLHLDQIIGDDLDEDDDPDPASTAPHDPGPEPQGPHSDGPHSNGPAGNDERDDDGLGDIPQDQDQVLPGLEPAGHDDLVDSSAPVREAKNVVTDQDDEDGPDQPSEETVMPQPAWTSTSWIDREGVQGWTEPPRYGGAEPCVVCQKNCVMVISGTRVHPLCFQRSTATERAGQPSVPEQAPAPNPQPAEQPPAAAAEETPVQPITPAPPTTATKPAAALAKGFRAAAAVVDVEGIWLSSGEHLPMPSPAPTHVGDLVRLAHTLRLGTQTTKFRTASGQLWITAALATQMGIDAAAIAAAPEQDRGKIAQERTRGIPAVTQALAAGYHLGAPGDCLARWTRAWVGSEQSVWLVLLPAISRDADTIALMGGDPDPATLARRIGLLAGALGHPYAMSGSTSGIDLMMALRWKDRVQLFTAREVIAPAQLNTVAVDINWSRKPTQEEQQHRWVHAYDRSGSYLAGCAGLELGIGDPTHHPDGTSFVRGLPGYWRIEIPTAGDWRMPNPLDPRGVHEGRVRWVTTPRLEFATELEYEPKILEAWTWATHGRVLDPWYEAIRDARTALDTDDADAQVARDQLKQIYAETIGMLGSHTHMGPRQDRPARDGYDPARRHHIVDKAGINIARRIAKIGKDTKRWPVAVTADTVLYTSDEADAVKAWPGGTAWFGRALGKYKHEGSAQLGDHVQFLTGGPYRGKDSLVPAQEWHPGTGTSTQAAE